MNGHRRFTHYLTLSLMLASLLLSACGQEAPTTTSVPVGATATTAAPAATVTTGSSASGNPNPTNNPDPPTAADMALCATFAPRYNLQDCKFDPPVTITAYGLDQPAVQYKWGETREDNVHTRWAQSTLGINQEYLWTMKGGGEEYETKIRLALSAGEKLPDHLELGNGPLLHDLIDSGQFMEVGPLFDKHASDLWKKIINESTGAWNPYTRDGKKMGIPLVNNWVVLEPLMWVRQDWLTKLNLEAPTTLDELEKVMDAFVNGDPDGNGQKDTYGLAVSMKNGPTAVIGDASWLFGAYGTIPSQWNLAVDGKSVVYGSVQPEVKPALAKLNEWMKKGYIHPEASLQEGDLGQATAQLVSAGKAGIVFGPYWLGWNLVLDLQKNVPKADLIPFQIPAGPDGTRARKGSNPTGSAMLINKNAQHPEAILYYMDYFYNIINPPPSGGAFEWGLHENYMWTTVNGKPTVDKEKIPEGWVNAGDYSLTSYPINPFSEYDANFHIRENNISTPFDRIYAGWPETQHKAQGILLDSRELSRDPVYTGAPTQTMRDVSEALETLELETYNKIMTGDLPLEAFDQFVMQWKSNGGDAVAKDVNDWYAALGTK